MQLIHTKSVLLILLLLVPRPSWADDTPLLRVAVTAYVVAHYADLHYTLTAIESGRGREANPLFSPVIASPRVGGAITMGLAVGTGWALVKLHATHPKTAIVAAFVGTAVFSGLAYHNSQVGR